MAQQLPIIQRATLEQQAYRTLRTAILKNELGAGMRLIQEELAARLGTSRIPVRDALRKLEAEGLVVADGRGTYSVATFSITDVEEVYTMRALLEPYAVAQAILKLTPALIEELGNLNQAMIAVGRAGDVAQYMDLNTTLHMRLYESSGLPRLVRSIKSLWLDVPVLKPLQIAGQLERSIAEHSALIDAVIRADTQTAQQTTLTHIQHARALLIAHLQQPSME